MPFSRNRVDVHVGGRVRLKRIQLGMDREALASKIAATPRDVQCVENGSKRIGAEALYGLSKILGVAPSYFFEGMQQTMEAFAEIGAAAKKPSDRADEAPKPSTRRRARSLQDH